MIPVSTTYDDIIENGGQYEWRVVQGNASYEKENIVGGTITRTEFTKVSVGCCTAATLDLNLWGVSSLSTDTPLTVQFRATDGVTSSEWYPKGTFFIDTIESSPYSEVTRITAYDAMLKTDVAYISSGAWAQTDTFEVLQAIAADIGVAIESTTYDLFEYMPKTLDKAIILGPNGTTERELLSIMGIMYACNFIIDYAGQLKAVLPGIAQFGLAEVGDAVVSFDASPSERITKVKVWLDTATYFRTPSTAAMSDEDFDALPGARLEVQCPFYASQDVSDYLSTYFMTRDFIPYTAQGAFVDPKYDIEDSVQIKNITSYITNQTISIDPLAQSDLELESNEALQSHYPYISSAKRAAARSEERIQEAVNEANYHEQVIYKSAVSGTNAMPPNTTWVTDTTGSQNTWTAVRPVYSSAYPVLFVATQRQSVEQSSGTTCSCTTPVKDQTTTVIDGGHITTGTIDAAVVNVTNLNADNIVAGTISDASGKNYWDLDNGEFVTQQGQIADFTIYNNRLEAGTYDVGNNSTVIKNGAWSSTFLKPYTHSGQTSWYTHITNLGDAVRFNIASPTDTMQTAKVAGRIEPFYNQSGDFMEMRLYGGNTLMMRLVNSATPYVSVSQEVQIGSASTPKDLLVTGDIDTDGEYLVQGQPLVDTLPDASTTTRGLVSTDDQEFAGTKTFPGLIIKQRLASAAAGFQFNTFDDLRNGLFTMNTYGGAGRRSLYRFIFTEYSLSSTTYEPLPNYEGFRLPAPDFDRTANATYDILTTKETATTGTITPESGWTLSSSSYLKKWGGHIVDFLVALTGGTYINGWNDVATFPAGFAPSVSIDLIGIDNGASTQSTLAIDCRMSYTGVLRVYKSATMTPTNNIIIHGTFIV